MREFLKKYRVLLGIEILLLLFLLVGCLLKKEELVISEDPEVWRYGAGFYKCENFALDAGVYHLVARTKDASTGDLAVGMRGEGSSYHAIRCNDVPFALGEELLEFDVYVMENVEKAMLVMISQNLEPSVLESVSLYSTNIGNRILLFYALLGMLLLDGLLLLRGAILEGKISGDRITAVLLVAGSVFVACTPLMVDYFVAGPHTGVKLKQIEMLKDALCGAGEWPAKSIHFLLPAMLRVIGFHIMSAYKWYMIAVISGMAVVAYAVLKKLSGDGISAAVGSMVYTLASSRLIRLYDIPGDYMNDFLYAILVMAGAIVVAMFIKWCRKKAEVSYRYSAGVIGVAMFLLGRGIYEMNGLIFYAAPTRIYNIEVLGKVSLSAEEMLCFEERAALLVWLVLLVVFVGGKQIIWKRRKK